MSGHSKWHNIAAKKGKADAARGKIFTKLGRELLMAVKQGGPDPDSNSKLRDVIAKCKSNNMPNDTINGAIKPSVKAKRVGRTKIGKYRLIALSMTLSFLFHKYEEIKGGEGAATSPAQLIFDKD